MRVLFLVFPCLGELGWEFYHAKPDTPKLYDGITHSAPASALTDFGWYAMDVLRLERGIPAANEEVCKK